MTEIEIMKKINNANVVKLYNFLETTNNCYVNFTKHKLKIDKFNGNF